MAKKKKNIDPERGGFPQDYPIPGTRRQIELGYPTGGKWIFGPSKIRPFRVKQVVLDEWGEMLVIDGETQPSRIVRLKLRFWILHHPEVQTARGGHIRKDWRKKMNEIFGTRLVDEVNRGLQVV